MLKLLRCLMNGHQYQFLANVYGDRATVLGCRSIWTCSHCRKRDFRPQLHIEGDESHG